MFGDRNRDERDSPDHDRFQAIVPAYTFNWSGRVTEWRACVQPGGNNEQYYIQFQIWRSTDNNGCYELVGHNTPLDADESLVPESVIMNGEGFLLFGRDNAPVRCVVLPVRESQQIEFQSGDVIGYYVDRFREINGVEDRDYGGIQWIEDDDVVVHYRYSLPREDIKSQYAISLSGIDPSACGFEIATGTGDLYSLSVTSSSAPIISLMAHNRPYGKYCTITPSV